MIKSAYEEKRKFREIKWLQIKCGLVYDNNEADRYIDTLIKLSSSDY